MPLEELETGLPSLSHVRPGAGRPEASHSSLIGSFTTTVTIPPLLEMEGGTERAGENHEKNMCVYIYVGGDFGSASFVPRHSNPEITENT